MTTIRINGSTRKLTSATAISLMLQKIRKSGRYVRYATRNNTFFFSDGNPDYILYSKTRNVLDARRFGMETAVGKFYTQKMLTSAAGRMGMLV
jgi:hypothetical protein